MNIWSFKLFAFFFYIWTRLFRTKIFSSVGSFTTLQTIYSPYGVDSHLTKKAKKKGDLLSSSTPPLLQRRLLQRDTTPPSQLRPSTEVTETVSIGASRGLKESDTNQQNFIDTVFPMTYTLCNSFSEFLKIYYHLLRFEYQKYSPTSLNRTLA